MDQAEAVSPERDIKLLLKKHRSLIDELKVSLSQSPSRHPGLAEGEIPRQMDQGEEEEERRKKEEKKERRETKIVQERRKR